jgi:hypothetical protein
MTFSHQPMEIRMARTVAGKLHLFDKLNNTCAKFYKGTLLSSNTFPGNIRTSVYDLQIL